MVSLLLYELVVQLSEHDEVLHRVPQLQLHGVLAHCSRGQYLAYMFNTV